MVCLATYLPPSPEYSMPGDDLVIHSTGTEVDHTKPNIEVC